MGVLRRQEIANNNDSTDDLCLIEDCQNTSVNTPSPSPSRRKGRRYYMRGEPVRNANFCRFNAAGARHARRFENLNQLLQLVENDEELDWDMPKLMEPTVSGFTQLFMEQSKMKIWNDFINRTEDDQKQILQQANKHQVALTGSKDDKRRLNEKNKMAGLSDEDIDKRMVHPAFSAAQCFKRIDESFRRFLKKRNIPLDVMADMEQEVTSFFQAWPTSVFVSSPPGTFERMILHTLCQYLDLSSHSFDDDRGTRHTEVENKHSFFAPPNTSLSQYLASTKQ